MKSTATTLSNTLISETSGLSGCSAGECGKHDSRSIYGYVDTLKQDLDGFVERPNRGAEGESASPFGRAFYEGKASYRIWNQLEIFLYSALIAVANGVYWNIGSVSAVQIVAHLYRHHDWLAQTFLGPTWYRPLAVYVFFTAVIVGVMAVQSVFAIAGIIAAK